MKFASESPLLSRRRITAFSTGFPIFSPGVPPPYNRFANGFSHIFGGGYAAGYYSYKWAEVLSADAFSKFEENGIFDRETGEQFLHSILEQGGSREPMELFVEFRGRQPSIDPLLRHAGILTGELESA